MGRNRQNRRVLVIGSGGRESAMCRALKRMGDCTIFTAPGNYGTSLFGTNLDIEVTDIEGIMSAVKEYEIDLIVPGSEDSLAAGVANYAMTEGIPCCGPTKEAAQLESSKIFTRRLCEKKGIPSPKFIIGKWKDNRETIEKVFPEMSVVKLDGLHAGKGVFVCDAWDDMVAALNSLSASETLLFEERLYGTEASLFYICDGKDVAFLTSAMDYKRLFTGDEGPNTGGMGAISPHPHINDALQEEILNKIVKPALEGLEEMGVEYKGFLYAGVMLTKDGPKLLEFNVRLGDPEAQAILPLIPHFSELCVSAASREHGTELFRVHHLTPLHSCCVVIAAPGYPREKMSLRVKVDTLPMGPFGGDRFRRYIEFASVNIKDDSLFTPGGRILSIVALDENPVIARLMAYSGIKLVGTGHSCYRMDIGEIKEPCLHKRVVIIVGSGSDLRKVGGCKLVLRQLGISYRVCVASAHRDPDKLDEILRDIDQYGRTSVVIAGAGLAAALSGVCASKLSIPVIGVPLSSDTLNGMDALLSIVQMPSEVPVACMGIDNMKNAAYMAARILALHDKGLKHIMSVHQYDNREYNNIREQKCLKDILIR